MKCETHCTDMEWVESKVDETGDGYWYCEQCQEEEEAWFQSQTHVGSEPNWAEDEIHGTGPDFGPWSYTEDNDPSRFCSHCGKEFEDFSDYGCEYCDRRL